MTRCATSPASRRPPAFRAVLVACALSAVACREAPRGTRERAAAAPTDAPGGAAPGNSAGGVTGAAPTALGPQPQGDGSAAPVLGAEQAGAMPGPGTAAPTVDPAAQACVRHEDCRVYRPSRWEPRVECCYEFGCALDYEAINGDTWERLRAWQRANPFDCQAELERGGPCAVATAKCGLEQEPPAGACIEGVCRVALPETWPRIDTAAQTCGSSADCRAHRTGATSAFGRCCGTPCLGEWVAINRDTQAELRRWTASPQASCDGFDTATCPASDCVDTPPPVACRGGACVVEPAR